MTTFRLPVLLKLPSALLCCVCCLQPVFAQAVAPVALIPAPREMTAGGSVNLTNGLDITCSGCTEDDRQMIKDFSGNLQIAPSSGGFPVEFIRSNSLPAEMQAEGYTLTATSAGTKVTAASSAGLFYGAQTLSQLIDVHNAQGVLHLANIRDWPAMRYRGMQDDLSRGPVPTLAFQKKLIRTLASYKMNLYSPYFEHTQQYASNPLPAPPGGSISAADARDLAAYAARYHVILVPDQEAFGHLHHNLVWEQYSALAETPHGAVLAPAQPGSLLYTKQMFTELAALYPGPFLHIGADETVDLGVGQTKADVDSRGLGPVYLDFMQKIVAELQPLHRKILFWGDIAQSFNQDNPDLLKNLPAAFKQNTIAVAWWYTAHPAKGFASYLTPFTSAGIETWVAPGVNNWSVVWPDSNDALTNIQQFVLEGQRQHSTGVLNTTWYDDGEALANNNWYGLLFGAAASWQTGSASIPDFQKAYGPVFHGDHTGALNEAQIELMKCHDILRNQAHVGNGSDGLFWMDPWSKDGQPIAAKLRPYVHDFRLHAEHALILIAQARAAYPAETSVTANEPLPSNPTSLREPDAIDAMELGARRMDFIGLKFQLADEITQGYSRALSAENSTDKKIHSSVGRELSDIRGINGRLEDIRDDYGLLRDLYEQAWLRSNRAYALRPVLDHYDYTMQIWQARIDRFRSAQRQYSETKALPSAQDMGLPR